MAILFLFNGSFALVAQGKPMPLNAQSDAFGRGSLLSRMLDLPVGRHHVSLRVK